MIPFKVEYWLQAKVLGSQYVILSYTIDYELFISYCTVIELLLYN